jgi:hypothetical protein
LQITRWMRLYQPLALPLALQALKGMQAHLLL